MLQNRARSACLVCVLSVLGTLPMLGAPNLNLDAVKRNIEFGLRKQLGVTVKSTTCPKSVETKEGNAFDCVAQVEETGRLTVRVTQTDDEGDVDWEVTRTENLIDLSTLEAEIKKGLEAHGGTGVQVDCQGKSRGKYRGVIVGNTFDCKAVDRDGEAPTIRVLMKDGEGNVTWKVVQE